MSQLIIWLVLQLQMVLCAFILVPVFGVGTMPANAELPSDLAQGIGVLAEYKSNAEQQAQILVRLAEQDDITTYDYLIGQSLYAQAKAGFDGWIEQLVFEIQFGTMEALSPKYEAIQEQAKAKGDVFTNFVKEQLPAKRRRGKIGQIFKSVFTSIKDAALSIATGFSKVPPAEQPAVIKMLGEYKWPEFHTIEERLQSQHP